MVNFMSFSIEIKKEIIKNLKLNKHCFISKLTAILNYSTKIEYNPKTSLHILNIYSENERLIKLTNKIIKNFFDLNLKIENEKNKAFCIKITSPNIIDGILKLTNLKIDSSNISFNDNFEIFEDICCKRVYILTAFIFCGYISNPEKNYHLEFINSNYQKALFLKKLINYFEIQPKIIYRKGYFILYLKEGEQIVNLLNVIYAHNALLKFENVRILKDVRNNVNRIVNCETANINKIVSAGVKQKETIEFLKQIAGLEFLPKQLYEIAILRLNFPDISLKELGEKLEPPISKSGVNHRLKKLKSIAEKLREK